MGKEIWSVRSGELEAASPTKFHLRTADPAKLAQCRFPQALLATADDLIE